MAQPPHTVMPPDIMQQHPAGQPPQMHPVNSYYPEAQNDLTGGLPMNLDSLRDGPPGSKPFYPYSTLIRYAIKGAPNQKLLLEDIYYAIESRFPYFRTAPPGWKNSVRHNLSLNPCFEKVPRPLTDRGKGSYWTVNDNVDPRTGVHRVRKKKTKGGKGKNSSNNADNAGGSNGSNNGVSEDIDYHPPEPHEAQFHDPNVPFVPPPMAPPGDAGPSRQPPPYPPYPVFDPTFQMIPPGMRYPQYMFPPDEQFEVDEHGNVNWHAAWLKELAQLQQLTEEQQKAGAEQEWYRMMLFRVRAAMIAPPINGEPAVGMQPAPPPGIPPNPGPITQE